MKLFLMSLAVILGFSFAHADMIKRAVLDVTCSSEESSEVIKIKSWAKESIVFLDGEVLLKKDQLTAGTEGSAPYLQAVGNGYNITVSGGDFETAFYNNEVNLDGTANVYVNAYNKKETYRGTCTGLYSFEPMKWDW